MSSTRELLIYADYLSQPARAVICFCMINNIAYKVIPTLILDGGNRDKKYRSDINPHGKIPSIQLIENQNTFTLYESTAILRYLSSKYQVQENWYNRTNLERRALIDQYLDWHHGNTREVCHGTYIAEFLVPIFKNLGKKVLDFKTRREEVPRILKYLSSQLSKHKYIVDDEISIADLILSSELTQLHGIKYDFSAYPYVDQYLSMMNKIEAMHKVNTDLRSLTYSNDERPKF